MTDYFRGRCRVLIALFLLPAVFWCLQYSDVQADSSTSFGIIQYNVKAGQGGWSDKNGSRDVEVSLIADKMTDPNLPSPVEFISLVQVNDSPISTLLGLENWKTIISGCDAEHDGTAYVAGTQIAYDSKRWKLVDRQNITNPLSKDKGYNSNLCWAKLGSHDQGRPYNIAYFEDQRSKTRLLLLVVHMPHCGAYPRQSSEGDFFGKGDLNALAACLEKWDGAPAFYNNILKVTGSTKADLKDINVMIVGDTNELGNATTGSSGPFTGDPAGYQAVFKNFGHLVVTTLAGTTCCNQDGWTNYFDRVVTNNTSDTPYATIIQPKNCKRPEQCYPLFGAAEEHKAIYAVVTFPAPK